MLSETVRQSNQSKVRLQAKNNLPVQLKPGQSEFASAMQFFSLLFHFSAILTKIIQNDRHNIMYNTELNFNDLIKSHSKNL